MKKICCIVVSIFLISSCSLDYGDKKIKFDRMPNFVFKNASLDRYEKDKLDLKITFKNLEVYDQDNTWAGETITFAKMNKSAEQNRNNKIENTIESKGYAGIIKIDEKKEQYYLGEKVFFEDVKEKLLISGKAFFWDKSKNVLYAPAKEIIRIKKANELDIKGSGFIANTSTREFEFSNSIEGKIETNKVMEEKGKKNE